MNELRVEADLRKQLWQSIRQTNPNAGKSNVNVSETVMRANRTPPTLAERKLLTLLVNDQELCAVVAPRLEAQDYENLPTATIFQAVVELTNAGAGVDASALAAKLEDDPWAQELLPALAQKDKPRAAGEALDEFLAEAENCLVTLRLMMVGRRLQDLSAQLANAERAGDATRRDQLAVEHLQLTKYQHSLRAPGAA